MTRIVWLAVADARGHLMRAHLMRGLLAPAGIDVDVVTTSDEGARFLEAMGTPAAVLSRHHRVEFDARQNMARSRTEARVLRYLVDPARCLRDLRWVEERARGAAFVVDDSFHPALVLAPLAGRRLRIVNVYARHLRVALETNFDGRLPQPLAHAWARAVSGSIGRAYASVEHALEAGPQRADGTFVLPPIAAAPSRSPAQVRRDLGLAPGVPLAAVYLNPHFSDPALAVALEGALREAGFAMHAVGEGYASRPGWRARDPRLADVVAAADIFVSAPGMGALAQASLFGTPLLVLATDQPEQRGNLATLVSPNGPRPAAHPWACVDVEDAGEKLRPLLLEAARALLVAGRESPRSDPAARVARLQARWADTFIHLVAQARGASPEVMRWAM